VRARRENKALLGSFEVCFRYRVILFVQSWKTSYWSRGWDHVRFNASPIWDFGWISLGSRYGRMCVYVWSWLLDHHQLALDYMRWENMVLPKQQGNRTCSALPFSIDLQWENSRELIFRKSMFHLSCTQGFMAAGPYFILNKHFTVYINYCTWIPTKFCYWIPHVSSHNIRLQRDSQVLASRPFPIHSIQYSHRFTILNRFI